MKTLSLYIHFPFCVRKCLYCDFYSIPLNPEMLTRWIAALIGEIELYAPLYSEYSVNTIYIGGGSPNLIGIDNFNQLLRSIRQNFKMDLLSEFTIEVNPAEIPVEFLDTLKSNGVNRISVGAQSFQDDELQQLGRIHCASDIRTTFDKIKDMGFDHSNLDLIYGIPGQTMSSWRESLGKALKTGVDHLSLYSLSFEEETPLYNLKKTGKIESMEPALEEELYLYADEFLADNGFTHYEISNWAKPACESQHNQVYWNGGKYLGLGPSAHSYDGQSRWWNLRSVEKYINQIVAGQFPSKEREILTDYDREIEYLFLQLRTREGLSVSQFGNLFHIDFQRIVEKLKQIELDEEFWQFDQRRFKLSPRGWFVSDTIIYTILGFIEEIKK